MIGGPLQCLTFFLLVMTATMERVEGQLPSPLASSANCSASEQERVSKEYEQCMADVQQRLRTGSRSLRQVCFRLEEQVNRCGNVFKACLSPQDLRRLKDVQIDAFVRILDGQNLAYLYRQCDVVREYQSSNRTTTRATSMCTVNQVEKATEERDKCVAEESKRMQLRLNDNTDDQDVQGAIQRRQRIVCDFIAKTIDDCYEEMAACHTKEELAVFRKEMYNLLEKSLEVQTADFKLEQCNTLNISESLTLNGTNPSLSCSFSFSLLMLVIANLLAVFV